MKKTIFILTLILGLQSCNPQYTCPTYMDNNEIIKTDSLNCKLENYGTNKTL